MENKTAKKNKPDLPKKFYIEYLNKDKGFKLDRVYFQTYGQAAFWAKSNFERFDPDLIKCE